MFFYTTHHDICYANVKASQNLRLKWYQWFHNVVQQRIINASIYHLNPLGLYHKICAGMPENIGEFSSFAASKFGMYIFHKATVNMVFSLNSWAIWVLQRAQKWKDDSDRTAYFPPLCGATGLPVARKPRWQKVVNKYLGRIPECRAISVACGSVWRLKLSNPFRCESRRTTGSKCTAEPCKL